MKNKLILLIIVLVVVGGAVFYFMSSRIPDGFTIYTNDEFGFSFQYPESWELIEYDDRETGTIVTVQSPELKEGIESGKVSPGYPYDLTVAYWHDVNNSSAQAGEGQDSRFDYESLEEYLNDDSVTKLVNKVSETEISGISAYKVIVGGYGAEDAIMFESDGLYRLTYSQRAETEHLLETFEIIK